MRSCYKRVTTKAKKINIDREMAVSLQVRRIRSWCCKMREVGFGCIGLQEDRPHIAWEVRRKRLRC